MGLGWVGAQDVLTGFYLASYRGHIFNEYVMNEFFGHKPTSTAKV